MNTVTDLLYLIGLSFFVAFNIEWVFPKIISSTKGKKSG